MIFHSKDFVYSEQSKTYLTTTTAIEHIFKNCNGLDSQITIHSKQGENHFDFSHAETCKQTGFVKYWQYANTNLENDTQYRRVIVYNDKFVFANNGINS